MKKTTLALFLSLTCSFPALASAPTQADQGLEAKPVAVINSSLKSLMQESEDLFDRFHSDPEENKAKYLVRLMTKVELMKNTLENLYLACEDAPTLPYEVQLRSLCFNFENDKELIIPFRGLDTDLVSLNQFLDQHEIKKDHLFTFLASSYKELIVDFYLLNELKKIRKGDSPVKHFKDQGLREFEKVTSPALLLASISVKEKLSVKALAENPKYKKWMKLGEIAYNKIGPHPLLKGVGPARSEVRDPLSEKASLRYIVFRSVSLMNMEIKLSPRPEQHQMIPYLLYAEHLAKYICNEHEDCKLFFGNIIDSFAEVERNVRAALNQTATGRLQIKAAEKRVAEKAEAAKTKAPQSEQDQVERLQELNKQLFGRVKTAEANAKKATEEAAQANHRLLLLEEGGKSHDKELKAMESELNKEKAKLREANASLKAAAKEAENLKGQLAVKEREKKELRDSNDQLKKRIAELEQRPSILENRVTDLEDQLSSLQEDMDILQKTLQDRTSEIKTKDARITQMNSEHSSLQKNLQTQATRMQQLQDELRVVQAEFQKLQAEYAQLKDEATQRQKQLADMADNSSSKDNLEASKLTIHNLNVLNIYQQEKIKVLEDRLAKLNIDYVELNRLYAELVEINIQWKKHSEQGPAPIAIQITEDQVVTYDGQHIIQFLSILAAKGIHTPQLLDSLLNNHSK